MRLFELHRDEDESGISGTGIVAQGVCFDDGTCALRWLTETASTGFYDNAESLLRIHGHGGRTRLMWRGPRIVNVLETELVEGVFVVVT